jgi:glycosyltransferase involved in cell wall biosynthesis/Tfp pilus assembly protein PilF/predicted O-methyltransferase YrrM
MPRFLFGPTVNDTFTDRFLKAAVDSGRWTTFPTSCASWEAATAGMTELPEVLLVWPGYTSVPSWVWTAPVPVVALAHDPNLLWSGFRHTLPLADLILTDAPSAERLNRAGLEHVRAANLFGLDRHFLAEIDTPEGERDIDIVFVGNLSPSVQAGRGKWLTRLGALAGKHKVLIASGVFNEKYRTLVRRAKLVFNHSIRGECNLRAFEAAASGAVLLQEADNFEVPGYLEPHTEFAPYTDSDFEDVVERLLTDEATRRAIATRAKERVRGYAFESLVEAAVNADGTGWDEVKTRATKRIANLPAVPLAGRVWQRVAVAGPNADAALLADLEARGDRHALSVLSASPVEAEPHLAAESAAGNRVSAVGHASALLSLGRKADAIATLRQVLTELDVNPVLSATERDSVPYPVRFDHLRVGCERAGYDHPDDVAAENREKLTLLKGRAAAVLAEVTGELDVYQIAAHASPHIPAARAALGCALARAGRFDEGIEHIRFAVQHDPFDNPAANLLEAAFTASGDSAGAEAARNARRVLAKAAPGLISVPDGGSASALAPTKPTTAPAPSSPQHPKPQSRFVELSREAFAGRFGSLDTSRALAGFTPPHDTAVVLALVTYQRPRRVLEIGTAEGDMTANLTAFTPADAIVDSMGIVAEDGVKSGAHPQQTEVPKRDQFAKYLNHFGTAHKAQLITADSRTYDFARLAPLDFAFVDGGHDYQTARSDSLHAYQALRPGGILVWHDLPSSIPWIEVERAVADLAFPEPVYKIAGTQVAFLFKGEGVGGAANADTAKVAVVWDGEFEAVHSLAAVNRLVCGELIARGNEVALLRSHSHTLGATRFELPAELASRLGRELPNAVTVRHRWPPDFSAPTTNGPFVLMQPWEYGRLPRAWIEPIVTTVDEVWAYSRSVLRAYVASGVPEDRVVLMPPGVDPDLYRPGLDPLPLPTEKKIKLLFVGGTIPRKGFDVLLTAYRKAFTRADDVCLVVKDMGVGTFYQGQTAGDVIEQLRNDPKSPEIVYLTDDLPEKDLARLYSACDALVHPYRGEGYALPVLEAMACGKPVVVTAGGPTDEFVPSPAGWKIPARVTFFDQEKIGDMPTAGRPWWLEPDADALVTILQAIVADAGERNKRGEAARRAALGWTWARSASVVEDRIRVLRARTPVRFRQPRTETTVPVAVPESVNRVPVIPVHGGSLSPGGVALLSDVPHIVPATPRGRSRVSLTMIVKNEEHNLGDCLASVRDLVDEAVVVDTGSTDRTREIARSFGAVLGAFPWIDHFAAARNAALDHATGDYAFWMDADDRLDDENRSKLKALIAGLTGGNEAYVMKCLCVPEKPGAGGTVVDHVRLFRHHPAHRWSYRVHEQILPSLRATKAEVKWSDVTVRHVGYVNPAVRRRKLDRDLRLLKLDEQERPNDPFTLFNLGSVYNEVGDHGGAIAVLEKSLAASHPKDSIVRKLYALIAQCQVRIGEKAKASETLQAGRDHYPDDCELLFLSAGLARERGDVWAAEELYRRLIDGKEGEHFASVDGGLRAVKGRHNLAVMLLDANRAAEAEALWRTALVADPHFMPAHAGLGELYQRTGNAAGVARQVDALRSMGSDGAVEGVILDARWRLSQKDHVGAAAIVEAAVREFPTSVGVRVALSHVRFADGSPPEVIEAALMAILELDPNNPQAKHNLQVLLRNTGRWIEGVIEPPPVE